MIYLHPCRVSTPTQKAKFQPRCLHCGGVAMLGPPEPQARAITGGLLAPRGRLVICTAAPWTCCPAGHLYAMSRRIGILWPDPTIVGVGVSIFCLNDFLKYFL